MSVNRFPNILIRLCTCKTKVQETFNLGMGVILVQL